MKCDKCGEYHRIGIVSCDEYRMTHEYVCTYCNPVPRYRESGILETFASHPRQSVHREHGNSREGVQVYRCPQCHAVWACRYQWDAGTGSDNVWFIIELPKEAMMYKQNNDLGCTTRGTRRKEWQHQN